MLHYSYINYANLVWGSTHRTYLRKINSKQKHALKLIYYQNRFYHSKELFESCEILNVYKLNLLNTALSCIKQKTKLPQHHSLKKLISLLLRIQHTFQVGITGNHKLNYVNEDFEFLLEVQQNVTM